MNQREKRLMVVVAGLVLLMAGNWGLDRYRTKLTQNQSRQTNMEQKLSAARAEHARGLRAKKKLQQWRQQSLPSLSNIAKSLYQDWLQSQLTASELNVEQLNNRSPPQARDKEYQQISFAITAKGTLAELVVFLHHFYQSNHLHRISDATLVPTQDRKSLAITLTVDALLLPNTDRTDKLATGTSDLLADSAQDYQQRIDSRNLFQIYQPSKPETQTVQAEDSDEDQQADQAKLTGMTLGQHGWRMAVLMKDSGKMRFFRKGDSIEIGTIVGKVVELDARRAIIETADQRLLVLLGQTLGQAAKSPASAGVESQESENG